MEKDPAFNGSKCGGKAEEDGLAAHDWKGVPETEITELGPMAWWVCARCPARTIHDPETEDGFAEEPIVVYPASLFDGPVPGCECPRRAGGQLEHLDGCIAQELALETGAMLAERFGTPVGLIAGSSTPASCGAPCPAGLAAAGRPCGEPRGHNARSWSEHPHRAKLGDASGTGSSWTEDYTPHPDEDTQITDPSPELREAIAASERRPDPDVCPIAFALN